MVLADHEAAGPYLEIWRRLAAPGRLRVLSSEPYPPGTCLPRAWVPPSGAHSQSLLTYVDGATDGTNCRWARAGRPRQDQGLGGAGQWLARLRIL